MFCAGRNVLCQTKNLFTNFDSHKHFVPDFSKIGFCAGTKGFEEALNAVKFFDWLKQFGPAQNILLPVKGQGISGVQCYYYLVQFGVVYLLLTNFLTNCSRFLCENKLQKSKTAG